MRALQVVKSAPLSRKCSRICICVAYTGLASPGGCREPQKGGGIAALQPVQPASALGFNSRFVRIIKISRRTFPVGVPFAFSYFYFTTNSFVFSSLAKEIKPWDFIAPTEKNIPEPVPAALHHSCYYFMCSGSRR